jgi:hypothetical protein
VMHRQLVYWRLILWHSNYHSYNSVFASNRFQYKQEIYYDYLSIKVLSQLP